MDSNITVCLDDEIEKKNIKINHDGTRSAMAQIIIVTNQREGKSSVRPYVPSRGGGTELHFVQR